MKKILFILLMLFLVTVPVSAQEITAPEAPDSVSHLLPDDRDSFAEGLWYVIKSSVQLLQPRIAQCSGICLSLIGTSMLISFLHTYEGKSKTVVELAGLIMVSCLLLQPSHILISQGIDAVEELSAYGKLLLPVMTTALAAEGAVATSSALYLAGAAYNAFLNTAICAVLAPMIYIYLVISIVNAVAGDKLMKKMQDLIQWLITWVLKAALYLFSGFITVTGIVSGTADQTVVKATKLTISGLIPVVGGILSDASETVVLSAGVVKNAAGIYGMLALIAIAIGPFLEIGVQYLMLKLTGAACGMFADKKISDLIEDFSRAMGFLLAMNGTMCLILLISVVCFLKGMG